MKKIAIGIDIGGTKISIAAGSAAGKILAYSVIPTVKGRQAAQGVENLVRALRLFIAQLPPQQRNHIAGIGVCLPGAVNSRLGVVPVSPNMQGWQGIKLARILKQAFHLPVRMVNDANAAAVAEMLFGAARRVKDFIYVTVSTGIGSGIVTGGCLLEGVSFVAGEVGHMTIAAGGDLCNCGRRGCFEAMASGGAIERYTLAQMKKKKIAGSKRYFLNGRVATRAIKAAAHAGNRFALHAFERAGHYLGIGLGSLMNILNPQMIILGGGVLEEPPAIFWKAMRQSLKVTAWPEAYRAAKVLPTPLKNNAGNLGALAVVFNSFPKSAKR